MFGLIDSQSDPRTPVDYNKIRVGRTLLKDDAFIDPEYLKPRQRPFKRSRIEKAIDNQDIKELRLISEYFFYRNGIYERLCRYMAYLYCYDWFITPIKYDSKINDDKVVEGWYKAARFLDNSNLKKLFADIALKVVKSGCYYGYALKQKNSMHIQELPIEYCRSRYCVNGKPVVEFNVKFFDDKFKDIKYREKVLKLFPPEFRKAYLAFKRGTLPKDWSQDDAGWFVLDVDAAFKFNLADSDSGMREHKGYEGSYYSQQKVAGLNVNTKYKSRRYRNGLANGIHFMAENEPPYLVHCSLGKDRAGFTCAVIECLAGAELDEVIADYMISFYNYFGILPGTDEYNFVANAEIYRFLCEAFGLESLEGVNLSDSAERYLRKIGVSASDIESVKRKLGR